MFAVLLLHQVSAESKLANAFTIPKFLWVTIFKEKMNPKIFRVVVVSQSCNY